MNSKKTLITNLFGLVWFGLLFIVLTLFVKNRQPNGAGYILLLLSLIFFVASFFFFYRKRLIENLPVSTARSMAMGLVAFRGTVNSQSVFTSWLSGQNCVYCKVQVQESYGGKWNTRFTLEEGMRFYLEDNTGKILVDLTHAELDLEPSYSDYSDGVKKKFDKSSVAFLEQKGIRNSEGLGWFSAQMRLLETIIAPGNKLFMLGTAVDNPEVEEASSVQGHRDILIAKSWNNPLFVSRKGKEKLIAHIQWLPLLWGSFIFFLLGLWFLAVV